MTNFEVARRLSGMSNLRLADALGTTPGYTSQLANGQRNLSVTSAKKVAGILDVDPAWIIGFPQHFPLYDPHEHVTSNCEIVRSEYMPDYGTLYHVYNADTGGIMPVIVAGGEQYTPVESQDNRIPRSAADIDSYQWMDSTGQIRHITRRHRYVL